MKQKTFIIFAAEVISENMNYMAEPENVGELDDSLEQNELLMAAVKRVIQEEVSESEIDELANELMGWNIVAWADSDEFRLHAMANNYYDELNAK